MKRNIRKQRAQTVRELAWLKWFDQSDPALPGLEPQWLDKEQTIRIYKRAVYIPVFGTRYEIRLYKLENEWWATFAVYSMLKTDEKTTDVLVDQIQATGTTPAKALAAVFVSVRRGLMDIQRKMQA